MRMTPFTWTALCASVLMAFAFPALTVACGLLALDRLLGMHFFTNELGGNMMNYPNLFWIWGHPEVYILILPAFGVFSEVVSTFSASACSATNRWSTPRRRSPSCPSPCGCTISSPWARRPTSTPSSASRP